MFKSEYCFISEDKSFSYDSSFWQVNFLSYSANETPYALNFFTSSSPRLKGSSLWKKIVYNQIESNCIDIFVKFIRYSYSKIW